MKKTNEEKLKEIYKQSAKIFRDFELTVEGLGKYVRSNIVSYLKKSIVFRDYLYEEIKKLPEPNEDLSENFEARIEVENYLKLRARVDETDNVLKIIPYSVLVSLISEFDYMINKLLRLFSLKISGVAKFQRAAVSFEDIDNCDSLEAVKEFYVDKYLDALFRKSHDEIFFEIREKFKVSKIQSITNYKDVLLITEWRNLIVHNDGYCNVQFMGNLKKFGIKSKAKECFKNGKLEFSPQEILDAIDVIFEAGIEIYYTLITKYFRKQTSIIDDCIADINASLLKCYENKRYSVGAPAINYLLHSGAANEDDTKMLIINLAMFYQATNDSEKRDEALKKVEAYTLEPMYAFAKHLILKDYEEAVKAMVGIDKLHRKYCFQVWPLCRNFIRTESFKKYYKEEYGEEFKLLIRDWEATDKDYEEYKKRRFPKQ